MIKAFILDAGHGMTTGGKRSPDHRLYEYEFNRAIVERVARQLDEHGIKYYLTYPLDNDSDLPLMERCRVANKIASWYGRSNVLFISFHGNAAGNGKQWMNASGFEIWTSKGTTQSDKYATIIWEEAYKVLHERYGIKMRKDTSDGDVDKEESFTVLTNTVSPAVLIEFGFYDNKDEIEFMLSDEGRDAYAELVVNAIKRIEGIE